MRKKPKLSCSKRFRFRSTTRACPDILFHKYRINVILLSMLTYTKQHFPFKLKQITITLYNILLCVIHPALSNYLQLTQRLIINGATPPLHSNSFMASIEASLIYFIFTISVETSLIAFIFTISIVTSLIILSLPYQ